MNDPFRAPYRTIPICTCISCPLLTNGEVEVGLLLLQNELICSLSTFLLGAEILVPLIFT